MNLSIIYAITAVGIWSTLAILGYSLKGTPSFLIVGIALSISGLSSIVYFKSWFIPIKTFAVGVMGIFGYHFLLFIAFNNSPAVEANLLNYMWPLLIVLLSPVILKGYNLKIYHILGAFMGLIGASLIVTGGKLNIDFKNMFGYLCAITAALTWATYSLMTKKVPPFSTKAVGGFCLFSGILSLSIYFSTTGSFHEIANLSLNKWMYLVLLGLGPMGSAFFLWDAAMKLGDPRIIGALAYFTPLFSTLLLVLVADNELSHYSLIAMILIILGAILGSMDLFFKKRS